ncbi:8-oxo-dGTP diphosphatase [Nocardia tenerifensis]|uniref:8-oxo-dGTP diphosphatase n=1 Tax=Nocardia tenerifensis TaxID=228006 RepID=A0A318KFN5_9NOCA|nr:NUDIX domain-containing protein [Nocardia tenerifensis]PXX71765.1 8-oxo-dGTP diphosphatase [Nocardia tenerifensis]
MTGRFPANSAVAVDLVILTIRDDLLHVLVVERANPPFAGALALPGGFLEPAEDLNQAAERELWEETGLDARDLHIEQVGAYGAPDRDPRGRVVSVCYMALMPDLPTPSAGGDARAAHWLPVETLTRQPNRLAFDHHTLLSDAVERAGEKLSYTTLAASFCPPRFTVAELRRVYEIVWGTRLDPSNFRRKVTGVPGFLVRADDRTTATGGRPAHLYRTGPAAYLRPALSRETLTGQR